MYVIGLQWTRFFVTNEENSNSRSFQSVIVQRTPNRSLLFEINTDRCRLFNFGSYMRSPGTLLLQEGIDFSTVTMFSPSRVVNVCYPRPCSSPSPLFVWGNLVCHRGWLCELLRSLIWNKKTGINKSWGGHSDVR